MADLCVRPHRAVNCVTNPGWRFPVILQTLVACLEDTKEQSAFKSLLSKVRDEQSLDAEAVVSVLKLFRNTHPKINAALLEREQDSGETLQQTGRRAGTPHGHESSSSPGPPKPFCRSPSTLLFEHADFISLRP